MTARAAKLGVPIVNVAKVSPLEEGLIVYDKPTRRLNVSNGTAWIPISGGRDVEDESDRAVVTKPPYYGGIQVNKTQTVQNLTVTNTLALPPKPRAVDSFPGSVYFDHASNNVIVTGTNGAQTTSVTLAATNNTIVIGGTPTAPTIGGGYVGGNGVTVSGNLISGNYIGSNGVSIVGATISGSYAAGAGISIVGSTISAASPLPAIWSTAFSTSTDAFYDLNAVVVGRVLARFPYAGSSVSPLSKFSVVLALGAGVPVGTITLVDDATSNVIATITYTGIAGVGVATVYSTSSISNLPLSASVINIVLDQAGAASSLLLYSALVN